jgi:peptidoglycan/LPS O-acetylase OafA/YrhL
LTSHINWLEARVGYLPGSWDVLWSLSVEETFYLAYPLLCRFVRSRVLLMVIAGALVIAGPMARAGAFNDIWYDYSYLGGMDCIAIGCVTALLARTDWAQRLPAWWLASCGVSLILVVWFRSVAQKLGLLTSGLEVTVLGIGVALVILSTSRSSGNMTASRLIAGPATPIFRWYGRNSYEIYLTHMFVVLVATQIFEATHASVRLIPLLFVSNLVIAGLLGYAVARWFSEPMNRKKQRRVPSPSRRIGNATSQNGNVNWLWPVPREIARKLPTLYCGYCLMAVTFSPMKRTKMVLSGGCP